MQFHELVCSSEQLTRISQCVLYLYIVGVLITGGIVLGFESKTAEVYLPASNTSCYLPELPEVRSFHTQDDELVCGGNRRNSTTSCIKLAKGVWTKSHNLRMERIYHVSWKTASGLYLIGGVYFMASSSTELLKEDGSVEEGFALIHSLR